MMRVLMCGGRNYNNDRFIDWVMQDLIRMNVTLIIHGDAKGADSLSKECARSYRIPDRPFPAEWSKYGRSAGSIRNKQMIIEGRPDLVVAFSGGVGTANMISQSKKHHIRVIEL